MKCKFKCSYCTAYCIRYIIILLYIISRCYSSDLGKRFMILVPVVDLTLVCCGLDQATGPVARDMVRDWVSYLC